MKKTITTKRIFWILVLGLNFINVLTLIVIFQSQGPFRNLLFKPFTQLQLSKIVHDRSISAEKLDHDLTKIKGITVRSINKVTANMSQYPIVIVGEYHLPVILPEPFILQHGKSLFLIKFNKSFPYASIIFLIIILSLFLVEVYLCYWAIKMVEKPSKLATSSVKKLSDNIYADLKLSQDHEEVNELSDYLIKLQHKLKSIVNGRTEILAAISHDLKTPVTRIKLRAELLDDPIAQKGLMKDIEEMELMINSIITFSKAFIHDEKIISFNLSELVDSSAQNFIDIGYSIKREIDKNIQYKGRVISLKRAINNILDNSTKYGIKNVSVSLSEHEDSIICLISDNGKGINKENIHKITQPFFREDETRNQPVKGSGLGLSIANEIIHSCGGELTFEKNKPTGLIVKIILPKMSVMIS